jgi:hypothetical protein
MLCPLWQENITRRDALSIIKKSLAKTASDSLNCLTQFIQPKLFSKKQRGGTKIFAGGKIRGEALKAQKILRFQPDS